ncbi:Propanediol utilization protein [Natronincola peptidivorans]|uniref:Phosphate propanoyltransferase n=1 Tax=Natronincola peptidivorans TaxID=426128 RepID=A0A1I0EUT2_9FIRM|nr:phosphate propanoyltransferase [Natronincola peptidivorans]SET49353.1 Propanediol utilization protein [Natronincola peptidivorans]
MEEIQVNTILHRVLEKIKKDLYIPIEISARHVHLSKEDIKLLFGEEGKLTKKKNLSQPGQYQYNERIMLIGPKGVINNVAILGPPRNDTQIEISKTDAITLGIRPPVRESGDLIGSESLLIATSNGAVKVKEGVIIAQRHIHMNPEDAERFKVEDNKKVKIKVISERPVIFEDVKVRVGENYCLNMHIDHDEANAIGFTSDTLGRILL